MLARATRGKWPLAAPPPRATICATPTQHTKAGLQHDAGTRSWKFGTGNGYGRNGERFSLLGSKGSPKNRRNSFGRNRQITRKPYKNGDIHYRLGLAPKRGNGGRGICANSWHAPAGSSSVWLFSNGSRCNRGISGIAGAQLVKRWPFTQHMVQADRKPTTRCLSFVHHSRKTEITRECLAHKRYTRGYLCKACAQSMEPAAGYAYCSIYSSNCSSYLSLRVFRNSFIDFSNSCISLLLFSFGAELLLLAPFWPVLCSKIEGLGTKFGLSFCVCFLSSLGISFLIESCERPMMENAGEYSNRFSRILAKQMVCP